MLQLSRPATWVFLFRGAHTDTDSDTGPGLPSQQHTKPALCSATAHWVLLLDSWCRSFNIALLANTHTGIKARIHITQAHTDTDAHIGQFLQGGNFGPVEPFQSTLTFPFLPSDFGSFWGQMPLAMMVMVICRTSISQNSNSSSSVSRWAREEPENENHLNTISKMMGTLVQVELHRFSYRKALMWPQKMPKIAV